ncbi:hypothetical protein ACBJ59_22825 [Nonomuraea sp. MTCD27]|uniref:hypothetical protein n=1 Tax=Nonomuraea sp. MTCD27 TaxID=1676747 RepID=UPI0035C16902
MTILVTGATGTVGRQIVAQLVELVEVALRRPGRVRDAGPGAGGRDARQRAERLERDLGGGGPAGG